MAINKIKKIGIGLVAALAMCMSMAGCGTDKEPVEIDTNVSTSEMTEEPAQTEAPVATEAPSENKEDKTKEVTSEKKDEVVDTEGKTPFEIHGKLSVSGTDLVDEHGNVTQLCGVSTHGIQWFPQYVNKDAFQSIRDDWGGNLVRLAMYTAEGGYCEGGNKANIKSTVISGVDYATDLGMYVLIDWHILHDLDPNVHKAEAIDFFDEMSKKYADNDHVLYEICNEPNGGTSWASVKSYAEEVIPVIKANNPDAIIIVGTPTWSQDVDEAAKNPITGYSNIMYAVHFYADTHKDGIRNKVVTAEKAGLPVFITEFSICDASGNGNNNKAEADKWIALLDEYNISFCAWNLSNKNESSSLIAANNNKLSGWSYDELSDSGKWLVDTFATHGDKNSGLAKGKAPSVQSTTDNQNNNQNTSQNNQPVSEGSGSIGNVKATVSASNSWSDGSGTCTQYTVTLDNTGSGSVSGWTIEIDFGTALLIDQNWCCKASVSGNKLIITPESFNSSLSGNSSTSDIGFIVKTSSTPGNVTVTVK